MIRVKTFDSTGIGTPGHLYAADLNAIQDAAAGLTDLTQAISAGSVTIGESGLTISRFGTAEAQIAGLFRTTGLFRAMAGLVPGVLTTTQRDALATNMAPTGTIIYNSTTAQYEWNSGTDASRVWKTLGIDLTSNIVLTGGASALNFSDQTASNLFLTSKRTADTLARFSMREDGLIEWGPGGATVRDTNLYRSLADTLKTDDSLIVAGAKGVMQTGNYGTAFPGSPSDGQEFTLVDSTTAPTYQWRFRYNAGSASAFKWEFIGGSSATMESTTSNSTSSASYVDPANNATFTVPRAGDYNVDLFGGFGAGSSATFVVSLKKGSAATADVDTILNDGQGGSFGYAAYRRFPVLGLAASDIVKMQWKASGGVTMTSGHRGISVQPIRCS